MDRHCDLGPHFLDQSVDLWSGHVARCVYLYARHAEHLEPRHQLGMRDLALLVERVRAGQDIERLRLRRDRDRLIHIEERRYKNVLILLPSDLLAGDAAVVGTWFLGSVILVFGHGLNVALGVIAVFAHGVRLNMLEFSNNAGVQWGGYSYCPFAGSRIEEN